MTDAPEKIGDYQILKTLGEGAMARVYLAERVAAGGFRRKCALKVVHPEFARDEKFIELMRREARLGALLDHPNIVNTIAHGDVDGIHFIDLEFVEGKTLDEFLQMMKEKGKSGLDLTFCLQIILPILRGLAYAHEFSDHAWEGPPGMVHRDLKPANIMLSNQGVVKIMDFGIAKAKVSRTNLTNVGQVRGTPVYMAPEQVTGKEIDGRADQFAAASVFFELVTGSRLFSGINLIAVMQAVAHAETKQAEQRLDSACAGLGAVMARMWQRLPEDRYANCDEAAAALGQVLANHLEGPVARPARKRSGQGPRKKKRSATSRSPMLGLLSSLTGRGGKKGRKGNRTGTSTGRKRRQRKARANVQAPQPTLVDSAEDWSVASAMLKSDNQVKVVSGSQGPTQLEGNSKPAEPPSAHSQDNPKQAPEGSTEQTEEDTEGRTISVMFMDVIFDEETTEPTESKSESTEDIDAITTLRNEEVLSQNTLPHVEELVQQGQQESGPEPAVQASSTVGPSGTDATADSLDSLQANMAMAALEPADEITGVTTGLESTLDLGLVSSTNEPNNVGEISETLDLNPLAKPYSSPDDKEPPKGPTTTELAHNELDKEPDSAAMSDDDGDEDEGEELDDFFAGMEEPEDPDASAGEELHDNDEDDLDDFFGDDFDS